MKKLVVLILMSIAPMFASASNTEIQENSSEHRQVISNGSSSTTVVTNQNEIAHLLEDNGFTDIDPKKVKTAIVVEANPDQIDEEIHDKVNLSASKMSSVGGLENNYYIKPSTIQLDYRMPYVYEDVPITGSPTFYNVKTSFGYIMPEYYYYILPNISFQALGYNKSYTLDVHASWGLYGYPVGPVLTSYVVYDIYLVEIWINTLFKDIFDTSIVIEIPIKLIVLDGTEE